jgi:hypothetical protein
MANGSVALRLVTAPAPVPTPEPPAAAAAPPTADDPILQKIAEATADVVGIIAQGIVDWSGFGMLQPSTRSATGDAFLQLYTLSQATAGELDFPAVARQQGKKLIRQRGPGLSETIVDDLLAHALDILARVSADERARAN